MIYIYGFRLFDPTKESVHHWFYSEKARNIIWRAKKLVLGRSKVEMENILFDVEVLLKTYFTGERDEAIRAITQKERHDLIETDEEGRFIRFCREAYDEFDIKDEQTTSELDALEEALETHFDADNVGVENVHRFEYFGCLALSKFEAFLRSRYLKYDLATRKYEEKPYIELTAKDRMEMSDMLLDALDCVSRGEAEKIRSDIKKMIDKSYIEKIQIVKIREDVIRAFEAYQAEQRKQQSNELIARRHRKNREIRDRAVAWFDRERGQFRSAAQAAKAYCEELGKQGIQREQSVVVGWFRSHAKDKKIRLRP